MANEKIFETRMEVRDYECDIEGIVTICITLSTRVICS